MHILFEATDKKKGMTLRELITSIDKASNLAGNDTQLLDQPVKVVVNFSSGIKTFEVDV